MALRVCTKFRPERPRVALAAYGQKSLVRTVAVGGEREGEGRKDKGWDLSFLGPAMEGVRMCCNQQGNRKQQRSWRMGVGGSQSSGHGVSHPGV